LPRPSPPEGDPEPHLPRFLALLATSRACVHSLRSFPSLRIRFVLRFSQPLDAFLRTRARGLIPSRCHVQSRPVQGVLLLRSHLSSSERACPLAVAPDTLTAEAVSMRRALDFEAFIRARVRCPSFDYSSPPAPATLLRFLSFRSFLSRRAPVLLGCSALDVAERRLRFRARRVQSPPAFAPRENRLTHLCFSQPARVFEPAVRKSENSLPPRLPALWISGFISPPPNAALFISPSWKERKRKK
jgi:hypothetical protein